jgi:hypothetical protein
MSGKVPLGREKSARGTTASGWGKVHIPIWLEAHPLVDLGRTCLLKQEQEGYFAFLQEESTSPVSKDIVLCSAFTSSDL